MRARRVGALPPDLARRVADARRLARERGVALYLVGGAVRDLLLHRCLADVDLVVESDAAGFARRLARELGADVKLHGRFGTAVLTLRNGERLDIATARAEDYERPGALPRVRAGSIAHDLARRDFTVNAMAIEVALAKQPELLDPFGGREDLRRKMVRLLHPRSAFDDATRAFRAVRYANRLGFSIERETRRWIRSAAAAGAADAISGDRLRREVALLFSERNRAAAVRQMVALGISRAIHPSLRFDAAVGRRVRTAERLAASSGRNVTWLVYLLVWMGEVSPPVAETIAARLNLPRGSAQIVRAWPAARAESDLGRIEDLVPLLERLGEDTAVAAAAMTSLRPRGRRILALWTSVRGVRLEIGGKDLLAAGVPPGPAIGRALSATRCARRDGAIRREDELAFALRAARS